MQKTYIPKKTEVKKHWYIIDAQDKVLGRLATRIATILRGKHKPYFSPHMDTGDGVIVINASKIKVSGKKLKDKFYRKHSGYPGGFKEINLTTLLNKNPSLVIRLAVKRMLPSGPLGRDILKKLKVYPDDKHPHQSQKPTVLEV